MKATIYCWIAFLVVASMLALAGSAPPPRPYGTMLISDFSFNSLVARATPGMKALQAAGFAVSILICFLFVNLANTRPHRSEGTVALGVTVFLLGSTFVGVAWTHAILTDSVCLANGWLKKTSIDYASAAIIFVLGSLLILGGYGLCFRKHEAREPDAMKNA